MPFTISFKAYARDFINPFPTMPTLINSDVDLKLMNEEKNLKLTKGQISIQTEYEFSVLNPFNFGFWSCELNAINTSLNNFILACNLVMSRVVLSAYKFEKTEHSVSVLCNEQNQTIKKNNEGKTTNIQIVDGIPILDQILVTIRFEDYLDVQKVQKLTLQLQNLLNNNLDQLQKLKSNVYGDPELCKANIFKANLMNALFEYEAAMSSLNRLVIFKHLYNSLEIITNIDGKDRMNDELDSYMSKITGTTKDDCSRWRNIYNRMKHIYRNNIDIEKYVSGIKKIPEDIINMRAILANKLIEILIL
ncbi:MAG: hypothetical protein QW478_10815 [Candidatus Micrarchaeaceae archaeon]